MLKFLGSLVVIAAVIGGIGYWRGWFTVDRREGPDGSQVAVGLDRDQMNRDAAATRKAFEDGMDSVKAKIERLRQRAPASDADRARSQQEVSEFERQRDELARKIEELKTASGARYEQLKREIRETLDRMGEALDRSLR
jgi:chromosome segregation ATPase